MLNTSEIEQFRRDGFLLVKGLLTAADLDPVIDALAAEIAERAEYLAASGEIADVCAHAPFGSRYAQLLAQSQAAHGCVLPDRVEQPALFDMALNPRLLDVVEPLIGSEIRLHPTYNIRAKPPARYDSSASRFYNAPPWHQDSASLSPDAENTDLIVCWIPLVDATVENGCLQVMPGVQEYLPHQREGGVTIAPERLPAIPPLSLPCCKGDAVLMSGFTPHRSEPNRAATCRWSLDIRYHPADQSAGRPGYPSFVIRSKRRDRPTLSSFEEWRTEWDRARAAGLPRYFRDDVRSPATLSRLV